VAGAAYPAEVGEAVIVAAFYVVNLSRRGEVANHTHQIAA